MIILNKNYLILIIPLSILLGYSIGLYWGIPERIEFIVDYGDNINEVMKWMNNTINESRANAQITYNKCCDGYPCTDTYYDPEKDICILTACRALEIYGVNCTYKPESD